MAVEQAEVLAGLTPLAQLGYGIAAFVAVSRIGLIALIRSRAEERAKAKADDDDAHKHFDPDELLAAQPVVKFFENVALIADNAKLQTEAQRNMSAVATLIGKRLEDGYEELRVFKAVRVALDEKQRRAAEQMPAKGWGG